MNRSSSYKVLIYCHDIFGLGHLKRSLEISYGLLNRFPKASILVLTGSPLVGVFEVKPGMDFVRMPGVRRPVGGELTPRSLQMDVQEVLECRAAIIEATARAFRPDIFIVDTKPAGLGGEILATLALLKNAGCRLVLGLRDVMDDPGAMALEWEREQVVPLLEGTYDHIWVYGLRGIYDPLAPINLRQNVLDKVAFTGYICRRKAVAMPVPVQLADFAKESYIVATAGGGEDGEALVDWVVSAYESDPALEPNTLLVFGPFMLKKSQEGFRHRIRRLDRVRAIAFDPGFGGLLAKSAAVISMGGYNTFCEILSADRKSIIVPRKAPKLEQYIRATNAERLGLLKVLADDGERNPSAMANAIRGVCAQPPPSAVEIPGLLDGMENLQRMVEIILGGRAAPGKSAARKSI